MELFLSFLDVLLIWGFVFYNHLFPFLQKFILQSHKMNAATGPKAVEPAAGCPCPRPTPPEKLTGEKISADEMYTVMQRLGIAGDQETDRDHVENSNIDVSEFTEIFVDEEPCSEEIKQAFEVFDVNGDGFIDATELQRVLLGLSMREGFKLEECERMICVFDVNGDGLLDFEEFVAVMEKCFS